MELSRSSAQLGAEAWQCLGRCTGSRGAVGRSLPSVSCAEQDSNNPRRVQGGRDHLDCVQVAFECPQGRRLHHTSHPTDTNSLCHIFPLTW